MRPAQSWVPHHALVSDQIGHHVAEASFLALSACLVALLCDQIGHHVAEASNPRHVDPKSSDHVGQPPARPPLG